MLDSRIAAMLAVLAVLAGCGALSGDDAGLGDAGLDDAGLDDGGRSDAGAGSAADGSIPDGGACSPPMIVLGGDCVSPTCAPDTCSGHGVCDDASGAPVCACDVGFTGARCEGRSESFYDRALLARNLADPDVVKVNEDLFFMSGTRGGRTLPVLRSTDLFHFELSHEYDPGAADAAHDYCNVWAPDLSRRGGTYHLYFSAQRVPAGQPCPAAGTAVTTFHATAPDEGLVFGAPELVDPGAGGPRSRTASGCPGAGCSRVIRIDSSTFDEGATRWLFYVWFEGGNNISSFRFDDPGRVVHNAGPAIFELAADEEAINEGPDVFERDGRYYLFFSSAWFDSQYAMHYVMAPSVAELTRRRAVRRHSRAPRGAGGALLESHGHNTIVERRGEYFNVFHQGVFEGGTFRGRDTYVQRLAFRADGSIHALNLVDVRWGELAGHDYSLDLVLRDGSVVGPCIGAGILGARRHAVFDGVCPSAGHRLVEKSRVTAFRLYYSNDGTWTQSAEVAYDGVSEEVFIAIPDAQTREVALRWNELQTGAEYSLDVQRQGGTWIGPCDGERVIGSRIEHVFDGRCDTPGVDVPLSDVQRFRICSAVGDDWAHARCGTVEWDGARAHLSVHVP